MKGVKRLTAKSGVWSLQKSPSCAGYSSWSPPEVVANPPQNLINTVRPTLKLTTQFLRPCYPGQEKTANCYCHFKRLNYRLKIKKAKFVFIKKE